MTKHIEVAINAIRYSFPNIPTWKVNVKISLEINHGAPSSQALAHLHHHRPTPFLRLN